MFLPLLLSLGLLPQASTVVNSICNINSEACVLILPIDKQSESDISVCVSVFAFMCTRLRAKLCSDIMLPVCLRLLSVSPATDCDYADNRRLRRQMLAFVSWPLSSNSRISNRSPPPSSSTLTPLSQCAVQATQP